MGNRVWQTRNRQKNALYRRARNARASEQRSRLRSAIKTVRKAVAAGDKAAAIAALRGSTSVIDSIADKKLVHKNAAARNKSRLAAAVKAMA